MTQPNPTPGDPTPTAEPTNQPAQPTEPGGGDGRRGGERTILSELATERDKRQALEKQIADMAPFVKQVTDLAPLQKLAEALGGTATGETQTDLQRLTERFDAQEKQLAEERQARWRAEVAAEKQLPAELAARLRGATREELAADAEALKALIPAPSGKPAPDPTQGARGPVDIDAQIRDAETKGDVKTAIRLKSQKLYAQQQNTR